MKTAAILLFVAFSIQTCTTSTPAVTAGQVQGKKYLEQAMIPVWVAIKKEELKKAEQYLAVFEQEWKTFLKDNSELVAELQAGSISEYIEGDIRLLKLALAKYNEHDAIELMSGIVYQIVYWRQALQEEEQLTDKIWAFNYAYEQVQCVINDQMLCLLDWSEFERQVREMNDTWAIIEATPLDELYYQLSTTEEHEYYLQLEMIAHCLDDFNGRMDEANREALAISCNEMEYALVALIEIFGNFDSLSSEFAHKLK